MVMLMRIICLGLSLLMLGSPSACGGEWSLMRWGAAKTFVTHEAQSVMHRPQVIDDNALILTHLSILEAVGHPIEVA